MPKRRTRKADLPKKSYILGVRLSAAQQAAIEKAAAKATLDPSTWVRMIALRETDWSPEQESEKKQ